MPNVAPRKREDLPELEPVFEAYESYLGFVPNSAYTMTHRPELARAFVQLTTTVNRPGSVGAGLKAMVGLMASTVAGCRYCQAHLVSKAVYQKLDVEGKMEAVWDFEKSDSFSDAERAALRLARDAAHVPNLTTPEHFDDLREHFDDGDIVELVAVIALFGFLNRWNDTMATDLEAHPLESAERHLAAAGWLPGKHAGETGGATA